MQEGVERRRRPPTRLGVEQERGFWKERLPRELSTGDPGSRQLTPQPSPPGLHLDQSTDTTDFEYQQLPASRSWDSNEIAALQVDWTKSPAATTYASTTSTRTGPERRSRTRWRRSGWAPSKRRRRK